MVAPNANACLARALKVALIIAINEAVAFRCFNVNVTNVVVLSYAIPINGILIVRNVNALRVARVDVAVALSTALVFFTGLEEVGQRGNGIFRPTMTNGPIGFRNDGITRRSTLLGLTTIGGKGGGRYAKAQHDGCYYLDI